MIPIGAVSTEVRSRRSRFTASRAATTASLITSLIRPTAIAPMTVGATRSTTPQGLPKVSNVTIACGTIRNAMIGHARRRPSAPPYEIGMIENHGITTSNRSSARCRQVTRSNVIAAVARAIGQNRSPGHTSDSAPATCPRIAEMTNRGWWSCVMP